jgi:hypothetical protein
MIFSKIKLLSIVLVHSWLLIAIPAKGQRKSIEHMPARANYITAPVEPDYSNPYHKHQFHWTLYYDKMLPIEHLDKAIKDMFESSYSRQIKASKLPGKFIQYNQQSPEQRKADNILFDRLVKETNHTLDYFYKFIPPRGIDRYYGHTLAPLVYEATEGRVPRYITYVYCKTMSGSRISPTNDFGYYFKAPIGVIIITAIIYDTRAGQIIDVVEVKHLRQSERGIEVEITKKRMDKAVKKFIKRYNKRLQKLA